jgi:hypothetical protein
MAAALKQVEDGLAALRTAADKHNATVADLRSRAAAAGAREINGGPGPQDAHVALGDLWGDGNGVRAGNVHVGPVDETAIAEAIRRTVHGDVLTYGEQPRAAYGVAALERHVVQAYG